MKRRHKKQVPEDLRLNPEARLCPLYDETGIKLYEAPAREMGVRVVDNFPEEHIQ